MNFTFNTTPEIHFGSGKIAALGDIVRPRMQRPVLICDKGVVSAGLITPAVASLHEAGLDVLVCDKVTADPPEAMVLEALKVARAHKADGVIGFGGGSPMDTAKIVAVLLHSNQTLADIIGTDQVTGKRAPLVLCPTTAGTGSEVTSISIITSVSDEKVAVVDDALYPDCAILDPNLTTGLPAPVTAATGIDAMVHAIEAYTNINRKNPVSDALAREALRLLSANIVRACQQPDDVQARGNMLLGAMLAGQAFANSPVGAVHGMAYPLGGIFHIPHGLSNALMLEPVLRFNAPEAAHLYAELADVIAPGSGDAHARCADFIDKLVAIILETGCPRRLSDVGITADDLPRMAEDALKAQRVLQNNPRPVTYDDALAMYRECL